MSYALTTICSYPTFGSDTCLRSQCHGDRLQAQDASLRSENEGGGRLGGTAPGEGGHEVGEHERAESDEDHRYHRHGGFGYRVEMLRANRIHSWRPNAMPRGTPTAMPMTAATGARHATAAASCRRVKPRVFNRARSSSGCARASARTAGKADLQRIADAANKTLNADPNAPGPTLTVLGIQHPAEIVNYRTIGATPVLLVSGLAVGAIIALGLTLASSVRRRKQDLALSKTLGFHPPASSRRRWRGRHRSPRSSASPWECPLASRSDANCGSCSLAASTRYPNPPCRWYR